MVIEDFDFSATLGAGHTRRCQGTRNEMARGLQGADEPLLGDKLGNSLTLVGAPNLLTWRCDIIDSGAGTIRSADSPYLKGLVI